MNRLRACLVPLLLLAWLPAQQPPPPVPPPAPAPATRTAKDLGLQFAVWSSKLRRSIVSTRTPYGLSLRAVAAESPAARAGLTRGTIVLEVNGVPLREPGELDAALAQARAGDVLRLHCARRKANRRLLDRRPWQTFDVAIPLPGSRRESV